MNAPEFPRPFDRRHLTGQTQHVVAAEGERAALARRFGISAIDRFEAWVDLVRTGDRVSADGRLEADVVQPCAVSGEDFAVEIAERLALRFVPEQAPTPSEEEVELDANALDEIEFPGHVFDLGEALAQTLALAIDPFACGPDAEAARRAGGIVSEDAVGGPMAEMLASLRRD